MSGRIEEYRASQPLVGATVRSLAAVLIVLATTSPVLGADTKDSVRWTKEELAKFSQDQPKPLWQTTLKAQETDFIKFLSKDRVLVGTVETAGSGWGPEGKEIVLLNAMNGETVWTSPRNPFGSPQTLLATDPVILLQGSKKIAALSPKDGTLIWERPWPGGGALPLPDGDRIVLFSQKKGSLSLSAVDLKDGAESWSASAENYPKAKGVALEAKTVGGAVLLVGPELLAFSERAGQQLWRKPFPGNFGNAAAAVALGGEDLYFTDGMSITKGDPTIGNALWREEFPGAAVRNLSMSGGRVFVLLREGGSGGSSDAIQALERQTGKPLWKCSLAGQAQSAMIIEGDRIYVTTVSELLAVDASQGTISWKAAIPLDLQGRRLLPDILRITGDRIVVARETGVLGVQKQDGRLLYAESIEDGAPFTYDYTRHTLDRAFESATPLKQRAQFHPEIAVADANRMLSGEYYRMALEHQQFVYASTAETFRTGTLQERKTASEERIIAADESIIAAQMQQNQERVAAAQELGNSIVGLGQAIADVMIMALREGRISVMNAEVSQTYQTHANSLQKDFYIRPRYQQNRGWVLTLVNINTGQRAEILLSPDNEPLSQCAPNLPAFSIDPSGSRILSKGLGLDPARYESYEKRAFFNPGGRLFRGDKWNIPYPSVLAFDLASLPSGQKSENQHSVPKPVSPEKKALNVQLIDAAFQNDLKTVKKTLDAGADVNAVDEYGQTALMLAAESLTVYGKKDIVATLLEHGADVSIKDPNGWTAIEHFVIMPSQVKTLGVQKGWQLLVKEGKKESEEETKEESKEEP